MRAPAALIAVPLLAGAAAAIVAFERLPADLPFISAAAAFLALVAGVYSALLDDTPVASVAVVVGCALAGVSLGAGAARRAYAPPLLQWFERLRPGELVILEGVLREDASHTPSGISLTLTVTALSGPDGKRMGPARDLGGVRLAVGGLFLDTSARDWRAGRTVRAPALLRRPSTYLNPGVPDERRALARRGIVLVGSIKSGALVEVVQPGSALAELTASARAWVREQVASGMRRFGRRSSGITTAVLIGDRSGLSVEDERRLQEAGTYHVVAISGGNIAILAVLVTCIVRLALIPARAAALLTGALLLFYGGVAGGTASVSRAVAVAVIVLSARAIDHRGTPLNALSAAAGLAAVTSPVVVLDPGFMLSFAATLGILLGMPLAPAVRPRRAALPARALRGAASAVVTLFFATMCAEAALLPLGATLFGRVPFAGLLLNFAAVPLMTVVQVAGLALLATSDWLPSAASTAAWLAHRAASGLVESARFVELAPWLAADVRPPSVWLSVIYYGAALLLRVARFRAVASVLLAAAAAVILIGTRFTARDAADDPHIPLRVAVFDVGQGDATAVLLPGGRTLLVDAGGVAAFADAAREKDVPGFDIGERVVTLALRAVGVRRLEGIVVTHGDPDHLQGAAGVLRHLRARSVWEGVPVPPHEGLGALAARAGALGLSWRTVQAGDRERFGDVEVRVLHPPLPGWERQRVRNEDSVVLEVRLGRVSIVLPGDIGAEGERAILPRLEPGRLVVLKAPHHGSASSSTRELLAALRPAAVIFSCGRNNRFGHPHPAVVARYRAIGTEILSTASDGAVFVDTDGMTARVWGWRGRDVRLPRPP